jgi:hypothetical protein
LIAHPFWLPGSEWILLTCYDPKHICAGSTSGEFRHLRVDGDAVAEFDGGRLLLGSNPRFMSPSYLLYTAPARNALLGVRFDPETLRVVGEPEVVYEGVRREAFLGAAQAATSTHGDLVLARGANADEGSFVWVDGDGALEALPFPSRVYGAFYLSHDRRRLAATVYPQVGPTELWFLDMERYGPGTRWAEQGVLGDRRFFPGVWLPGSDRMLVLAFGEPSLVLDVDARRAVGAEVLWSGSERGGPIATSPSGRVLLRFDNAEGTTLALMGDHSLSELPVAPSEVLSPLVPVFGGNAGADFSPDGRWLVYHSPEAGSYQVYAVRIEGPSRPIQISSEGGESPLWSPQGDGIYYRLGRRFYWVPFVGSEVEPFGEPEVFAEGDFLNVNGPDLGVSGDGSRLLLLQPGGRSGTATLDVALNFRTLLAQVLGGGG